MKHAHGLKEIASEPVDGHKKTASWYGILKCLNITLLD
jgi:hypothetical protein